MDVFTYLLLHSNFGLLRGRGRVVLLTTMSCGMTTSSRQTSSSAWRTSCVTRMSAAPDRCPFQLQPITLTWWLSGLGTISSRKITRGRWHTQLHLTIVPGGSSVGSFKLNADARWDLWIFLFLRGWEEKSCDFNLLVVNSDTYIVM